MPAPLVRWGSSALAPAEHMLRTLWLSAGGKCAVQDGGAPLRFWIDEYAFSEGETAILRENIEASGGAAVLAGETRMRTMSRKGYYAPSAWDVYWTSRQECYKALPYLGPGQRVSCLPGIAALTDKASLVETLVRAYGELAFSILPRSFLLPEGYWAWRLWREAHAACQQGPGEEVWVLKEDAHRGAGVHVLPIGEAVHEARRQGLNRGAQGSTEDQGPSQGLGGASYDMVQQYVSDQLTIDGRKFYVRAWVLVTAALPLRVYLFDGGVVPFGAPAAGAASSPTSPGVPKPGSSEVAANAGADLIVNLWRLDRGQARTWSVADLRVYLGNVTGSPAAFDGLWAAMQRSIGLAFAAAAGELREEAAALRARPGTTFELVGVDFLVDRGLRPWLLEVNAMPSLARKVLDSGHQIAASSEAAAPLDAFDAQKEASRMSTWCVLGGIISTL
ncbi:hypothetical protein WJX81_005345 [Elliptochloris bilobata]|uniref:Tubulin--tyrosine ligase-like protein 5 n=1 Tax=Elliptochloris bilobata TaxID=381761 RepID=A0AAW1RGZ5_9CHLO